MRSRNVATIDEHVHRPVLQLELAALKSFGQRLAHGLLDDARPGEADERTRLGQIQISQHGQAC